MRVRNASLVGVVTALLAAGCASSSPALQSDGRVRVVTTVAPITSIVSAVVGDLAQVTGIVPEGTNSHTFEPPPSVARVMSDADVVYLNGLQLEEPTRQLAEANLGDGADIVELGTITLPEEDYIFDFSFPESGGKPNPHLWTDPTYALRYAKIVADDMSERDPANAGAYAANVEAFGARIAQLDVAMRESFATIPNRTLLTYHDAYAYFAETYDWEVLGAIQVADFEDPTPREVAKMIDQIKATDVPAIFGSEVFPSPVLERIGDEAGVQYVDVLRDDDLPGEPGDPDHSWMGLMIFDYITMTTALGGDASALEVLDLDPVTADTAEYPQ
ncbi:MAG: metal ABC transporter substrate-binding protein [Ilumatobacter sp.]